MEGLKIEGSLIRDERLRELSGKQWAVLVMADEETARVQALDEMFSWVKGLFTEEGDCWDC